jgi:hypothetical protein
VKAVFWFWLQNTNCIRISEFEFVYSYSIRNS